MVPILEIKKGWFRKRNVLSKVTGPTMDGAPCHDAYMGIQTHPSTDQTTSEEMGISQVTLSRDKGAILENGQNGQMSSTLRPHSLL